MSRVCWPCGNVEECDYFATSLCKLDNQPCDNRINHPKTNPELLDDGNQYLVIEFNYKEEWLGDYSGSCISTKRRVVTILNSLRGVENHKKKHKHEFNYIKIGDEF